MFALLKNSFRTCFLSDFSLRCFDLMSQVAGRTKQSFMRLGLTVRQFCIFSLFVLYVTIFWRCEFSIGQMPNAGGILFDSKIGEVVVLNSVFCFLPFGSHRFKCLHVFPRMFKTAELVKSGLAR